MPNLFLIAFRQSLREARELAHVDGLSLDFKLGFRMLVKYPGLTIVAGLAMAFAIWVGTVTFELVSQFVYPSLSLPGGDRIVQIRNWDVDARETEPRSIHDFVVWRNALTSVTDLGAYRDLSRNLIAPGGDGSPVNVAEITASAFRLAPTKPLLGRVLGTADEMAGAPPVIVLGYDVWKTRFAGDASIVGRSVQLGESFVTVVGVMPDGFAFPVAHDAWTPLHSDLLNQPPRQGPGITIFGRLAPNASPSSAQVELSVLGKRAATESPTTHAHLRPQVIRYTSSYWEPSPESLAMFFSMDAFAVMLLVLVCSNVALLLFARAATREAELVVRTALGASRGRIIAQLFAEALVLGAAAAAIGLTAAHVSLQQWGLQYLQVNLERLPFWFDVHLSPASILYTAALTLLGATIAGVLPALKITRGVGTRLRKGSAGGGGLQFGGVWTAVIVTQVAFTVAFPAIAFVEQRELLRIRSLNPGFAAEEFLAARMDLDTTNTARGSADTIEAARRARFTTALATLQQRISAEPGVAGVTFVDRLPRTGHVERNIELDEDVSSPPKAGPTAEPPLREVSIARVDPPYFDVLKTPILAGRRFHSGDVASDARAVIVDRAFVDLVLHGRNAIGRRVRFAKEQRGGPLADDARPWYEIVGVVNDLGVGSPTIRRRVAGLYLATRPGSAGPLNIVIHAQGDPLSIAPRLRALAAATDPALRLSGVQRVDRVTDDVLWFLGLWLKATLVLTGIAIVLALAGIYSVLSFTVARRTREIGVRVALGATPRRVVAAIFRRPLTQVCIGVAIGGIGIGVVGLLASGGGFSAAQVSLLLGYATFMLCVCLLACVVPTRRALSIEPTEALRAE
jgi:putative ABC transport system permease protein